MSLFKDDPEDTAAAVSRLVSQLLSLPEKAKDAELRKLQKNYPDMYEMVTAELNKAAAGDSQDGDKRKRQRLDPAEMGEVFTWLKEKGAAFDGPLTVMARVIGKELKFTVPINPGMLSNMLARLGIREKRTRPAEPTPLSSVPRPSNDAIALLIAVADRLVAAGHSLPPAAMESLVRLRKAKPLGRPKSKPKSKPKDMDEGEATPV